MSNNNFKIQTGMRQKISDVIKKLIELGYTREAKADNPGTFAVSGGNISIYAVSYVNILTLEFFGDEIERIFEYNIAANKIAKKYDEVIINPNFLELEDRVKIKPGDYLVHEDHGIGIFLSIQTKRINNEDVVYILIEYLNGDVLNLPLEFGSKLSPYIGVGRKRPKLSKLGSTTWQRTYKKTYENVILLAKELLNVYAKRELSNRQRWVINKEWKEEIEKTFGYRETEDQKKALNDIFLDLVRSKPIDRLICGDVGYGKTEIAIRVMAQAVANGYQVAMLVPTTILAEQHFITLKKRFYNLPVVVEHLSRFVKNDEEKRILKSLKNGSADIIIGTHSLFGANVKFKQLGLLIIDEEQKFGVKHKEKLKKLKINLDALSLTATPIPRTLFMALSGLRDISQISSPPAGRLEVDTRVAKYNEEEIAKYINREIVRKGQVYYLHNEVRTIEPKRKVLQKLFPKLNIGIAHGQMGEIALAKVMSDFAEGRIDVLVCSTIIENGLDLPNVNTLIADDSDKFGLSQLYQIRGRIGRSKKKAYALFTYRDKKIITTNAFKRLKAIVDNSGLGSGYNIALSDLEIRGGGNILGKEQHGNMEAVGLVLYTKLLNKAVEKLKK
ncbi:MAG: DEAD/DEAH box helicase [Patescibacteria group bacterium]|nr:DEAD/DEAH box helicase [Patescibacteria group bacterium]